jgi:hypothetical protein
MYNLKVRHNQGRSLSLCTDSTHFLPSPILITYFLNLHTFLFLRLSNGSRIKILYEFIVSSSELHLVLHNFPTTTTTNNNIIIINSIFQLNSLFIYVLSSTANGLNNNNVVTEIRPSLVLFSANYRFKHSSRSFSNPNDQFDVLHWTDTHGYGIPSLIIGVYSNMFLNSLSNTFCKVRIIIFPMCIHVGHDFKLTL